MSDEEVQDKGNGFDEEPRPEGEAEYVPQSVLSFCPQGFEHAHYLRGELAGLNTVLKFLLGEAGRESFYKSSARDVLEEYRVDVLVLPLVEAQAYGRYGVVPSAGLGDTSTATRRRIKVAACIDACHVALQEIEDSSKEQANTSFDRFQTIWKTVAARETLDFGGRLTLEHVALLADVAMHEARCGLLGMGHVQDFTDIPAGVAWQWLGRQPEFYPSRWCHANDHQHLCGR